MNACGPHDTPRLVTRIGVGSVGVILQQQELEFKRLFIENPLLIYVERGTKRVRWSGGEYLIRAGEAIALAGGQSLDITNRLAEDGSYRAFWLAWDDTLIVAQAHAHPELAIIRHAQPLTFGTQEFREALQRAMQAVEDERIPSSIAPHRLQEILIWIGMHGCRFEHSKPVTMGAKLRRLIGQDFAREWNAPSIASIFAMSEATLRRKLADEGTNLSKILVDARMSFALQLLQSTMEPVAQIALTVGYQTPSQFAVRFRDRFGFPPTAIRGHRRVHIQ
ncbi:AraC family transcriptional regulator [Variovorax beijingensis]|uniref:AraC family transcriptional regulator n=1 Tax=Variovorax beijingensis TaxID=2496117 RepID=A0A3P3E693_9BURK|nr:AraC family transcriptional regulator [Variovorax beijingensis]RRH81202.1 AraC family transcriptional regulator [Variovorax beijingensis]